MTCLCLEAYAVGDGYDKNFESGSWGARSPPRAGWALRGAGVESRLQGERIVHQSQSNPLRREYSGEVGREPRSADQGRRAARRPLSIAARPSHGQAGVHGAEGARHYGGLYTRHGNPGLPLPREARCGGFAFTGEFDSIDRRAQAALAHCRDSACRRASAPWTPGFVRRGGLMSFRNECFRAERANR